MTWDDPKIQSLTKVTIKYKILHENGEDEICEDDFDIHVGYTYSDVCEVLSNEVHAETEIIEYY